MKKMKPQRYIQPDREKVKDKITENITMEEEIKILRETLSKVLEIIDIDNIEEFQEYDGLIKKIKKNIKSEKDGATKK